jgi:hypothetical protein
LRKDNSNGFAISALDIENIQHRAIRCRVARASGHRLCQQAFKLLEVAELGPNVSEMMRGNLADFAARGFFRTITAAYRFTASISFANPAVTLARGFTTTFTE